MSAPAFTSCLVHTSPSRSVRLDSTSGLPKPPRIGAGQSFVCSPGLIINTNTEDFSRMWNVADDWKSLPRIPPLYILGATQATVRGGSPSDLTRRICEVLRESSLDAVFDDRRAKAFVTSADRVEFFIRLFQDNSDISSRGVIVEVQRKRGCAYRFHRYARLVMRAAGGAAAGTLPRARKPSAALLHRTTRPASLGKRVGTVPAMPPMLVGSDADQYTSERALETADDLLRKDRIDANELGMESLILLTDEESSGADRALHVCRVLLTDNGEDFDELKKMLATRIVGSHNIDEDEKQDAFELRHNEEMRRHALTVLGNCFDVLARHETSTLRTVLSGQSWVGENGPLLPALVGELGKAETHPHDACEAARCLKAILMAAPEVAQSRVKELGAPEKLMAAQGVGQCRHSMLERESSAALAQVQL
eukprot:CAMPEP_0197435020 /NCGR_PEP_ID=MMETSP1175-20131217/2671_1 /TAXON_ID=1003142 /ORGANISM="Triceratium dubium, Strain CCMP147" /LENGTH=422 /DNA_ID=CAMNT_0042963937 /DNA_START=249 /DNA_END=1517 /DNA_ORIENTATION=+